MMWWIIYEKLVQHYSEKELAGIISDDYLADKIVYLQGLSYDELKKEYLAVFQLDPSDLEDSLHGDN